jgi:hypothetical protein
MRQGVDDKMGLWPYYRVLSLFNINSRLRNPFFFEGITQDYAETRTLFVWY